MPKILSWSKFVHLLKEKGSIKCGYTEKQYVLSEDDQKKRPAGHEEMSFYLQQEHRVWFFFRFRHCEWKLVK